jgi:CubicO group peptidase (beta-lactamase class C family)
MLRDILEHGRRRSTNGSGVTPGGVLIYGDQGRDAAVLPFGRSQIEPPQQGFEVATDTIYDIASLTKPMATAACFMKLGVDPNKRAISLVPELCARGAERITFAHLLGHTSGLPAHQPFYERLRGGERMGRASTREALFAMVCRTALTAEPGTRQEYSDLGYIALGLAIERATGRRLDQAVRKLVTEPLGLSDTFYIDLEREPSERGPLPLERIAPTELCSYRGLVHAEVHDDNAHAGSGIFGHAGLFSTAGDVASFARAMLELLDGRAVGEFSPEVVRSFTSTTAAPDAVHTLGWDRPSSDPERTHTGELWPREGLCHLGFTGVGLWLDPQRGRYLVLLTNRVHPNRDQPGIREFRQQVTDAVVRTLDAT